MILCQFIVFLISHVLLLDSFPINFKIFFRCWYWKVFW